MHTSSFVCRRRLQVPRRSTIELTSGSGILEDEDLILNERSLLVVTSKGYIKRMPLDSGDFKASTGRGSRGKAGAKLTTTSTASAAAAAASLLSSSNSESNNNDAADDQVAHFLACNDHDTVMFITSTGRVLGIKAWKVTKTMTMMVNQVTLVSFLFFPFLSLSAISICPH